jgi:DNA-directed RNA polymerase subunit RPC12/RpoP
VPADASGQPTATQEVAEKRFGCRSCGADLVYAAGTWAMKCPYCGAQSEIPVDARAPREHDIAELDALPLAGARGLGVPTRSFKCDRCGAVVAFAAEKSATKCTFCDSPAVIPQPSSWNLVAPESLVPFQLTKEQAVEKFRAWVSKLRFRPGELKNKANVAGLNGLYVPYFTYDSNAHSDWSGEAGFYYYETHTRTVTGPDGRPRQETYQVQKIRWVWKSGTHGAFYNDELLCASRGLAGGMIEKLGAFNLAGLVGIRQEFLSGFDAEEYTLGPKEGWGIAAQRFVERERAACSRELGGDTQRNLSVSTRLYDARFKHLLLPVYIASYQYGGKVWRFMVNGQSGQVVGESPVSWAKVGIAAGAVVGIVAAVIGLGYYLGWF